jgi:hypothetical protein
MLKNFAKRVVPAASQLPQDDLNTVVEGLRAKNLLNLRQAHKGEALLAAPVVAAAAPPPCSRQVLGDELYEKLHCVCARSDFFGSFGRDILVGFWVPVEIPLVRVEISSESQHRHPTPTTTSIVSLTLLLLHFDFLFLTRLNFLYLSSLSRRKKFSIVQPYTILRSKT